MAGPAAQESDHLFKTIFDHAVVGIYRTTPNGRVLVANPALIRMLGFSSLEELKSAGTDVSYLDPRHRTWFREQVETEGRVTGWEATWTKKDGAIIIVRENAVAVRDESGSVLYYEGSVEDITDRKEMERRLVESYHRLEMTVYGTVGAMAKIVEYRDPYTAGHQERVARLAQAIAGELGLNRTTREAIYMAGAIHDVGKIAVPSEILSKPTQLNDSEFSLIKTHPRVGHDILKDVDLPEPVSTVVLQHHEKLDGSGYPEGLQAGEIIQETRILTVADIVESLASHRPYRPSRGLEAALEEIEEGSGTLYDSQAVKACLHLFHRGGYSLDQ